MQKLRMGVRVDAQLIKKRKQGQKIKIASTWTVEHLRQGKQINRISVDNIMPNQVINHVLDGIWSGATTYATWYILIFSSTSTAYTPASTDTYATPNFTEASSYTGNRPTWQEAGASAKSITNSANKASFTMNGNDAAIYGCALVNVATPGDQAASNGILGPVAHFPAAITGIVNNDEIKVYVTISGSDA